MGSARVGSNPTGVAILPSHVGGLAQSVECVVSNDEAPGSKPGFSTLFGARAIDWNQKRSPGVTTHRTDLPGYGPAILPLSTAAAFPCSVAGLRRFTAHYQPRGPRLRANPAVDHRLGSDRPWLHMTSQVGGAKHRIHIGLGAHSGHRRALPRPTNQMVIAGSPLATGGRMHDRPLCLVRIPMFWFRSIGATSRWTKMVIKIRIHEAAPR